MRFWGICPAKAGGLKLRVPTFPVSGLQTFDIKLMDCFQMLFALLFQRPLSKDKSVGEIRVSRSIIL